MPTRTAPAAALSAPAAVHHVTVKLQVPATSGDHEYHLRMSEPEILSVLDGTARCLRLPDRFGSPSEIRYLLMSNIVEFTVDDFPIPPQTYIAETEQ